MIVSVKADEKLKEELITRFFNLGIGFRVFQVKDGQGNIRLALKLDKKSSDDETVESHGIYLLLDPVSGSQLKNLELDYLDGPSGGFILKEVELAAGKKRRCRNERDKQSSECRSN
jgi:Fe-S cluster assembly iron-binding protein IscA